MSKESFIGHAQPAELRTLADGCKEPVLKDALVRAADEIARQRGYIDQLHAQLDASLGNEAT
jgi:hypothetical protein